MSGRKWSPVTMKGERNPGRSAYMVEFFIYFNVDAMNCKANYISMTYSLLRYEEETPVSDKKNSLVMKRASICEYLCD